MSWFFECRTADSNGDGGEGGASHAVNADRDAVCGQGTGVLFGEGYYVRQKGEPSSGTDSLSDAIPLPSSPAAAGHIRWQGRRFGAFLGRSTRHRFVMITATDRCALERRFPSVVERDSGIHERTRVFPEWLSLTITDISGRLRAAKRPLSTRTRATRVAGSMRGARVIGTFDGSVDRPHGRSNCSRPDSVQSAPPPGTFVSQEGLEAFQRDQFAPQRTVLDTLQVGDR